MPEVDVRLMPCSNGSSMPSPTDRPPASLAPRLAASMIPGPPPVMTAKPSLASAPPISIALAYSGLSGLVLALPKTVTARGNPASAPKPSTNSAWIRSTRHGSVCTQSVGPRESSSRWSVVLVLTDWVPRSTTGPRCFSPGTSKRSAPPGPVESSSFDHARHPKACDVTHR